MPASLLVSCLLHRSSRLAVLLHRDGRRFSGTLMTHVLKYVLRTLCTARIRRSYPHRRQLLRLDSRAAVGNLHRHHDESSLDPSPVDDEGRLQSHIEAQLHDHAIRLRPPLDHLVAALDELEHRRVPDPSQVISILLYAGLRFVSGMLRIEERQPGFDVPRPIELGVEAVETNYQSFLLSAQRFSDRAHHQITIVYKVRKINETAPVA